MWQPFNDWTSAVISIITNKVNWSWSVNSRCKYIDIRIDMRDGSAVIKDVYGNRMTTEELLKQLKGGELIAVKAPTLEELGIDCSNLKK